MTSTSYRLQCAAAFAAACTLTACSDDDSSGSVTPPINTGTPITAFVSMNGPANAGEVARVDRTFQPIANYSVGQNQGVALDYYGNLFQSGDGANGAGVRVFARARSRENLAAFDPEAHDRHIGGVNTALVNPKGMCIAQSAGFLFIADQGASNIAVFGTTAGGDVPPLAIATLATPPWDVDFDELNDRLFVTLTDGTVAVVDGFIAGGFQGTPTRLIVPSDAAALPIGVNLHGIAYEAMSDRLIVSDVGDALVDNDGALYVIANASTADGNVRPVRTIAGPATRLGNPVDIALDGDRLRVAEKLNGGGQLLLFEDIFSGTLSDVAPMVSRANIGAESLVLEPDAPDYGREASDLDGAQAMLMGVLSTRNDASNSALDDIRRHDPATLLQSGQFNTGFPVESLDVDRLGDVYVTTSTGRILVLNRVATGRLGEDASVSRDRVIQTTGLISPKGLDVVDSRGLVFVAELSGLSGPRVLAYSTEAQAFGVGAPPLLELELPAMPWDVDYDEATDRLYVSLTDGSVAVFDGVLDGQTPPAMPDRIFAVELASAPGARYSVNLHGIVYDAVHDRVFVSDVNATSVGAFDTDGRIFVIDGASTASGLVQPRVHIEGATTRLGNPVDLAFDGVDLFVAEKANSGGAVLRFADVAALDTSLSTAVVPATASSAPDVESIAVVPMDLAPARGGSIHTQ